MGQVKRRYNSPRREQQALQTRRAILDAAEELFTRRGFEDTSIRQIAEKAAVSEQTIYNTFGDKVGLLYELGLAAVELGTSQAEKMEAFLVTLEAEADPLERIRKVARVSREAWEQPGNIEIDLMVFERQRRGDPRIDELARRGREWKLAYNKRTCEILFPNGIRRAGLEIDQIAEFSIAIDSAASVTELRALGWSMDDWEDWLVFLLSQFLDASVVSSP